MTGVETPARPSVVAVGPEVLAALRDDPDLLLLGTSDDLPAATRGSSRWVLVAHDVDAARDVVETVMAGRLLVFGLAGVVLLDGPQAELAGVPVCVGGVDRIAPFWRDRVDRGPVVPADYAAAITSDRVTARTRAIAARRALPDDPGYVPRVLDDEALDVLRRFADLVVPQDGPRVDLAARVDAQLADGLGDGWRFDDLPPDAEAYRAALADLAGRDLDEALLTEVAEGGHAGARLTATQLQHWFQDAVVDLVRQWLAHPANLSRAGYDGQMTGGDVLLGFPSPAGPREAWEPTMDGATR